MSDDFLKPGGALAGRLFQGFLKQLSEAREPEPGERIGPWRIVNELGRGGSGVVFLAERADGAYTQQVALKWLRGDRPVPGGREVMARERQLLASLDHPCIARLIDGGETDDGMLWFCMDHVDGQTIDRHARALSAAECLGLVRTLCQAVQHAHRRGLIHGDIKPSNVLVDGRGQPRLLDFGISRLRAGGLGSSFGLTPDYASPEQRRGDELTTASDIWQLGHLLEDLLGEAAIPADLQAVIDRATAESPDERYASAQAMAGDIQAFLERRPVLAHGGGAGYRMLRFAQRNAAMSAVVAAALVVIIGGGVWMTLQLAAERDLAQAAAERAERALGEAESELARSEGLRHFLIGLFRATRPDRPRDQLPTTEELLEEGARRALDTDAAPDSDRIGMLLSIGDVYINLGMSERAAPLIDEALSLARANASQRPDDLARALIQKAVVKLYLRSGDREEVAGLLEQAEQVSADLERARDTWMHARTRRAWLRFQAGAPRDALALLEPVIEQMDTGWGESVSDDGRLRLANTLSAIHDRLGERDKSLNYALEAVEFASSVYGAESLNHAINRANLAATQIMLAEFDQAQENLDLALDLYQRIYDDRPVNYRAAALNSRAVLNLYAGRYEQALADARSSTREWSGFLEIEPEQYRWRDHHLGWMLLRMQRLDQARDHLERAVERFSDASSPAAGAIMSRARLAVVVCRLGDAGGGQQLLAELDDWPAPENIDHQAEISEARAACLFASGRLSEALEAIDASVEMGTSRGEAMVLAQRLGLRAEILDAKGREDAAARTRQEGRAVLREAGLDDHPQFESLHVSVAEQA